MKFTALFCLLIVSTPSFSWSAEIAWQSDTYSSVTTDPAPIPELLQSFAADQGIPIVISDGINEPISVKYQDVSPQDFLDDITQSNGLIWYFDGVALYVNKSGELASDVIALENVTPEELRYSLAEMGVSSIRFPLKTLKESGLVYAVGPPRHLELVKQLASLIDERAKKRATMEIVTEVFVLQYAWADNQVFFVGGTEVSVPGVATILDSLINGQADGPLGVTVQRSPRNLNSLIGQGLIRPRNQALARAEQAAVGAQIAAAQADAQARAAVNTFKLKNEQAAQEAAAATIRPVIQADRRRNAIIIRDLKDRMEEHRRTIEKLDVSHAMVQIEASIIDVDADHGFEFGPPVQGQWRRGGNLLSASARIDTPLGGVPPIGASASSGNLTLSLSSDGVTQFMSNLQALETEGHARVVSKPSVLTLDNIEAFLNESEEFFVRVAGFEQADLFNVNVGTTMRIIPHIVYEPSTRKVKLNISLEDGARSATASVDQIPVVSRNTINTQAVLMEGQSLLIAGLMRESTSKIERRVPLIGRLPVIGHLAKTHDNETVRLERMVLLTPTIVELPTVTDGAWPGMVPVEELGIPQPSGHPESMPLSRSASQVKPMNIAQASYLNPKPTKSFGIKSDEGMIEDTDVFSPSERAERNALIKRVNAQFP